MVGCVLHINVTGHNEFGRSIYIFQMLYQIKHDGDRFRVILTNFSQAIPYKLLNSTYLQTDTKELGRCLQSVEKNRNIYLI